MRIPAALVLIFLLIRGYLVDFKDRKTAMILLESRTLEALLSGFGINLPGLSTILDNVNAITSDTLDFILDMQIMSVRTEKLDDFGKITVDSTDVESNGVWPTDSGTISGLAHRAEHLIRGLTEFGIVLKLPVITGHHLEEIEVLHKSIQLSFGKKDSAKKRKKAYRKLIKITKKLRKILLAALGRAESKRSSVELMPSSSLRLKTRLEWITVDLHNLKLAMDNAAQRVLQGGKVKAEKKILSLSDEDAAMIVKGSREPTLGSKPQVARSETGFVTAIVVPEGNASDSGQLRRIVDKSMKRTGVKPSILSFDDGYTNGEDRDHYLALKIKVVSFSGSKGKRLIPSDEYESKAYIKARNDRSAVESTIFVLKHNHGFDRVMRRGIDNVRSELLEKSIAHNFFRIISIRKARQKILKSA